MSKHTHDELLDDYSRRPIPEDQRASGLSIALITFGVGITLPVFWLGADVTQKVGFGPACWIFFLVCILLGGLCYFTALVGNRARLSTYMVLHFSFGRHGAKLLNCIVAVTLLGFYSATVDIFGSTVQSALQSSFGLDSPAWVHVVWGSVLMTATAIFGFRGMDKLSVWSVPLMGVFMLYVIYLAVEKAAPGQISGFAGSGDSLALAISSTIGMVILTPVLMPDFTRYARTDKDSLIATLGMSLGFPLVLLAGGLPSIITGQTEIVPIMAALGLVLPALFILVFSTWTTNTANLYSAVLTLATFIRTPDWRLAVAGSLVATGLALAGFMTHFLDFILALSIVTPPIASIYLVDFFYIRRQRYDVSELDALPGFGWAALIAWALASAVAWMTTYEGWTLTSQPTIDSLLIAAVVYPLLARLLASPKRVLANS
ncbi:MAG: cytosine permease [Pseudomonas sp.]